MIQFMSLCYGEKNYLVFLSGDIAADYSYLYTCIEMGKVGSVKV